MIQKNALTNNGGQQLLNENRIDSTLSILRYSIKEFLNWWYIKMLVWHLKMLERVSVLADDNLSLTLLLKNFFLPWHRDYSFIGYVFGILIKLIYLPFALITYLVLSTIYLVLIVLWLVLPPATILFILRSIFTL
ncbi:MAG TPA: hypothetical protein PKH06_01090 [Candidatus Dojkabacteria bacterium]|nr:hypothetical protein [Candidatus Dojkabacteria bacterium]HNW23339.1 hypothetical protein [Candidatus Dojkabacteria bacterium]